MNLVESVTKNNVMGKNGMVRKVITGMTGKGGPGVKVNKKFDVPYGAGASVDGKTVYIDHRVPDKIHTREGKTIDVTSALVTHETTEKKMMDKGLSYSEAHRKYAIPAENAQVKRQGVDPKKYNADLEKKLLEVRKHKDAPTPPDLDPKPYKETQKLSLLKSLIHKHGQEKK